MTNPLSWLPSAEILGNAWNVYAVICISFVFVAGVHLTKHSGKSMLYRIIFSSLIAWCLQLVFIEMVGTISQIIVLFAYGNLNLNTFIWMEKIGPVLVDIRPLYITMPVCVLGYFGFVDKKVAAPKRIFNWNKKWIFAMILTVVAIVIARNALGLGLPSIAYPAESIERYVTYYLFYVPSYTVYAILGIKLYSKRRVELQ